MEQINPETMEQPMEPPIEKTIVPTENYFPVLCMLKGGCFGCCGNNYGTEKELKQAIVQNTLEFKEISPQTEDELVQFRERYEFDNLLQGLCRNLIEEKGKLLCPLHPARNKTDLRIGHCDQNFLCDTAKKFRQWDKEKQIKLVQFINAKELTNIQYSLQMVSGKLLDEFRKNKDPNHSRAVELSETL